MRIHVTTLSALVAFALAGPAAAAGGIQEVLTPAQYFECQIAAQRATIIGLEERIKSKTKINATAAEKRTEGEVARQRVTAAMYGCGQQNASTLGAYAHRNADELQAFLNANPQVKARLDASTQRVRDLAQQMPAVSPSAKR